jgi:hypothetical protein
VFIDLKASFSKLKFLPDYPGDVDNASFKLNKAAYFSSLLSITMNITDILVVHDHDSIT